jgi:hypothetical protein
MTSRPELKVSPYQDPAIHRHSNTFQVDDEGGFIKFFKSLPDNGDDTVRIFDRGDFYTAHGDNASFIARTVIYPSASKETPLTSFADL